MLKRHEISVLLKAGHSKIEVARLAGVSLRSVKRVVKEGDIQRSTTPPSISSEALGVRVGSRISGNGSLSSSRRSRDCFPSKSSGACASTGTRDRSQPSTR